jgi:hypothetical protein
LRLKKLKGCIGKSRNIEIRADALGEFDKLLNPKWTINASQTREAFQV